MKEENKERLKQTKGFLIANYYIVFIIELILIWHNDVGKATLFLPLLMGSTSAYQSIYLALKDEAGVEIKNTWAYGSKFMKTVYLSYTVMVICAVIKFWSINK